MFVYLAIAAELAILSTAFWYLYVREPRPVGSGRNPWGRCGDNGFTTGGIDPTLPFARADMGAARFSSADQGAPARGKPVVPAFIVGNPYALDEFCEQASRIGVAAALRAQGRRWPTSRPGGEKMPVRRYRRRRLSPTRELSDGHRSRFVPEPCPATSVLSRLVDFIKRRAGVVRARAS